MNFENIKNEFLKNKEDFDLKNEDLHFLLSENSKLKEQLSQPKTTKIWCF